MNDCGIVATIVLLSGTTPHKACQIRDRSLASLCGSAIRVVDTQVLVHIPKAKADGPMSQLDLPQRQ